MCHPPPRAVPTKTARKQASANSSACSATGTASNRVMRRARRCFMAFWSPDALAVLQHLRSEQRRSWSACPLHGSLSTLEGWTWREREAPVPRCGHSRSARHRQRQAAHFVRLGSFNRRRCEDPLALPAVRTLQRKTSRTEDCIGIRTPATPSNPSTCLIKGRVCFWSSTTSCSLCPFWGMRISRWPCGNGPSISMATLVSPPFAPT